jgi:putative transposase
MGAFQRDIEAALRGFIAYCDNARYRESLDNVTPADVYFGRQYAVLTERDKVKRLTMKRRKREYLAGKAA